MTILMIQAYHAAVRRATVKPLLIATDNVK